MDEGNKQHNAPEGPKTGWQYNPGQPDAETGLHAAAGAATASAKQQEITWTASEFIAHHKGASWYGAVIGSGILLTALAYFITRDTISTALIAVAILLLCIAASRKPRIVTYSLTAAGISIGRHFYPYDAFRSFSVDREGPFANIEFMPLHRFMPQVNIYCPPENESNIIEVLSNYVPMEERSRSYIDSFMRQIRF